MSRKAVEIGKLEVNTVKILVEKLQESNETHQSLADKTGLSRPTITKTLAGSRATTLSELSKIANALGLKLSTVIAEAEASLRKPSPSAPSMLSEAEAYAIAEELDRKLRAGMTFEELGLAAKTREIDPLDARGEESQIPPDWNE